MYLQTGDWGSVATVIERHAQKQSVFVKQLIREQNQSLMSEEKTDIVPLLEKRRGIERAVAQYRQIQKRLEQVRSLMQTGG